jgi:hypothetical protein
MTPEVIIRPAVAADELRLIQIMFGDPPAESVWITGSTRKARALGAVQIRTGGEMGSQNTIVAEAGGEVVGMLQPAQGGDGGVQVTPALAFHTLRIVGPFGIPGTPAAVEGARAT